MFGAPLYLEDVAALDSVPTMLSRGTQTAPGTCCAGSVGLQRVPARVRSGESHLQLDPTLEWHACTADGRVGRDTLHLQPRVLQVWRRAHGAS